ncbi:MAG: RNA-binding S4 domain-containing protein [Armatimonadetes bacterium]|nr:RNA-binding S4 domain-containing protein [Armatimonadota bacterium]
MRLDKFLQMSRLVKRRTLANQLCDRGRVTVNGREARASHEVKVADLLEVDFGPRRVVARVAALAEDKGTRHRAAPPLVEIVERVVVEDVP